MTKYTRNLAMILSIILAGLVKAETANIKNPAGDWLVKDKTAHIRIVQCGATFQGVISWAATVGKDEHNPDLNKRSQSILGLPVLLDMQHGSNDGWDGKIYNADNGKTYRGNISLKSDDILHVKGCVMEILCGGEDWMRLKSEPYSPGDKTICASVAE